MTQRPQTSVRLLHAPCLPMHSVHALVIAQEVIRSNLPPRSPRNPSLRALATGRTRTSQPTTRGQRISAGSSPGCFASFASLYALGMARINAHERMGGGFAAGEWVAWGTGNKSLPIRQLSEDIALWEVGTMDATANPYIRTAALTVPGLKGINKRFPDTKNCTAMPGWLPDNEVEKQLSEHCEVQHQGKAAHGPQGEPWCLAADMDMGTFLASRLWKRYIELKGHELENFAETTEEERRQRLLLYR